MTSTEAITLTAKEVRTLWVADLIDAASAIPSSDIRPLWDGLVLLMLRDGPALAMPSNEWWARRFRWIQLQVESARDPREIVILALRDLKSANENDGR